MGCVLSRFSCVCLWVTPWTVAHQAPLSMGILQGKNTGVGCHALLQGIFPTQELTSRFLQRLLHNKQILYQFVKVPRCNSFVLFYFVVIQLHCLI